MDITQAVFTIVGANFILMLSSIGIAVTLYLHTDKKIDAMSVEMKDFHGKLCAMGSERNE